MSGPAQQCLWPITHQPGIPKYVTYLSSRYAHADAEIQPLACIPNTREWPASCRSQACNSRGDDDPTKGMHLAAPSAYVFDVFIVWRNSMAYNKMIMSELLRNEALDLAVAVLQPGSPAGEATTTAMPCMQIWCGSCISATASEKVMPSMKLSPGARR